MDRSKITCCHAVPLAVFHDAELVAVFARHMGPKCLPAVEQISTKEFLTEGPFKTLSHADLNRARRMDR